MFNLPRASTKKYTTLRVHPEVSVIFNLHHIQPPSHPIFITFNFPEVTLRPEGILSQEPNSALRDLHLSESFPFKKSPTPSQRPRSSVHRDHRLLLHRIILPMLKMCNAPTLKWAVIHGSRFSDCNPD